MRLLLHSYMQRTIDNGNRYRPPTPEAPKSGSRRATLVLSLPLCCDCISPCRPHFVDSKTDPASLTQPRSALLLLLHCQEGRGKLLRHETFAAGDWRGTTVAREPLHQCLRCNCFSLCFLHVRIPRIELRPNMRSPKPMAENRLLAGRTSRDMACKRARIEFEACKIVSNSD